MAGISIIHRFRSAARRFVRADQGNIAVIFGIACVPLITFVGVAVDYSRLNAARSSMQSAIDSTALMVSKDLTSGVITASQVTAAAQNYFAALYTNKDATTQQPTATYTVGSGSVASTVLITVNGSIKTDFLNVAGFPTLPFSASSTATWGNVKMRVALVLDNTGSMSQDGKITALRNAVAGSGGLIDQLSALAKTPGDVYISVVPFAKNVNLGASNYSQSWIDWTDWQNSPIQQPNNGSYQAAIPNSKFTAAQWANVGPGSPCPFTSGNGFPTVSGSTYPGGVTFTCTSGSANGSSTVSTIPSTTITINGASVKNPICPSWDAASHTFYNGCWDSVKSGSTYTHTWYANATSTWTGCITDRTQPNDATGVLPTTSDVTTLFPANQYDENSTAYCSSSASTQLEPVIPLSYNWTALKTAINAMQPTGGTNQEVGLAWGWQTLLQNSPVPAPAEDANTTYNRVIIILSDGLNTEDRWPVNGNGSTQNTGSGNTQFPGLIDYRQKLLCDNLKNARDSKNNPMYTIYTIQANTHTPADATSTILQYCASSPDKFYMLTSSSQILTTFNSIGTALSKLRVAQ